MGGSSTSSLVAACVVIVVPSAACFNDGLGDICSFESDCEKGLRCVEPEEQSYGVCTVGCSREAPCEDERSICVKVEGEDARYGYICLERCSEDHDCDTEEYREDEMDRVRKLRCLDVNDSMGVRSGGACWF
jgi:hypothetical protein